MKKSKRKTRVTVVAVKTFDGEIGLFAFTSKKDAKDFAKKCKEHGAETLVGVGYK